MLHAFGWKSFLIVLVFAVGIYYIIIFIAYFRKDAKQIITGKRNPPSKNAKEKEEEPGLFASQGGKTISENSKSQEDAQFSLAHSLGSQLKKIIQQAAVSKTVKEELMMGIRVVLTQDMYQPMKGTAFATAINNLIAYECEHQCSVHLSALEVNGLWVR